MFLRLLLLLTALTKPIATFKLPTSTFLPSTLLHATATPLDTSNNQKGVYVRISPIPSLTVTIPSSPPSPPTPTEIANHITRNPYRPYSLESVTDFVQNGGVREGDVAVCDWSAVHVSGGEGWSPGSPMKGVAKIDHEFDVDSGETAKEPWRTFATNIKGSGQMQTASFEGTFPETYPVERMKGVVARFQVVVKRIMKKVEKEDGGSEEQYENEVTEMLQRKRDEETTKIIDLAIREEITKNYVVELDSKKATESVSWAKFGAKSGAQYNWQLVMETICLQQSKELGRKIEVTDLMAILRDKTSVIWEKN